MRSQQRIHNAFLLRFTMIVCVLQLNLVSFVHFLNAQDDSKESERLVTEVSEFLGRAEQYSNDGDFKSAVNQHMKAIESAEKFADNKHPFYAFTLSKLAALYFRMKNFDAAESYYQQAVEIQGDALLESSKEFLLAHIDTLKNFTALSVAMNKRSRAIQLLAAALELQKFVVGEDNFGYITDLGRLATLFLDVKEYEKSLALLHRSLRIQNNLNGGNHPYFANTGRSIAIIYFHQKDYEQAEKWFLIAAKIQKKSLGKNHPDHFNTLLSLANMYFEMGVHDKALPLYHDAMLIHEELNGVDTPNPDIELLLSRTAHIYKGQGDFLRAERLYSRLLEIQKQLYGDNHINYFDTIHRLGTVYYDLMDYERAGYNYGLALGARMTLLGENHPDIAVSLNDLALLHLTTKDYGKAERLYTRSLEIEKNSNGKKSLNYITLLRNLGGLYYEKGDYENARLRFSESIELSRQLIGVSDLSFANTLVPLALLHEKMEKYKEAKRLYDEALTIFNNKSDETASLIHSHTLALRGRLHYSMGDLSHAESDVDSCLKGISRLTEIASATQSERIQHRMITARRGYLDLYLSMASQMSIPASKAYQHVIAWEGIGFTKRYWKQLIRDNSSIKEPLEKLQYLSIQIAKAVFTPEGLSTDRNWEAEVDSLRKQKEQMERELSQKYTDLKIGLNPKTVVPTDLQKTLPEATILIDFFQFRYWNSSGPTEKEMMAAFIIHPNHPIKMINLGPIIEIEEDYKKWNWETDSPFRDRLYHAIWKPLEPFLGDVKTVLISPDGILAEFPFGALPGQATAEHGRRSKYLIEDFAISTIPVPMLISEITTTENRQAAPGILLVGNVDYQSGNKLPASSASKTNVNRTSVERRFSEEIKFEIERSGVQLEFRELPSTAIEIEAIRKAYTKYRNGKVKVLSKSEATKSSFCEYASQYPFIHVATHGFYLPHIKPTTIDRSTILADLMGRRQTMSWVEPGLLTGLAFANAQNTPQSAILTAMELGWLDLRHVNLLVLSACSLARGEVATGEGIFSIQRAAQLAGARSVVASSRRVVDIETTKFMEKFYQNLLQNNLPPGEALRRTQISAIKNGEHPTKWASWSLSGKWF